MTEDEQRELRKAFDHWWRDETVGDSPVGCDYRFERATDETSAAFMAWQAKHEEITRLRAALADREAKLEKAREALEQMQFKVEDFREFLENLSLTYDEFDYRRAATTLKEISD